jgi:hypothetical protein
VKITTEIGLKSKGGDTIRTRIAADGDAGRVIITFSDRDQTLDLSAETAAELGRFLICSGLFACDDNAQDAVVGSFLGLLEKPYPEALIAFTSHEADI